MSEVDSDSVDSSQAISPETPKYVPNTQEREDDDVPFVTSNHPFIAVSPIRPVETANNSVTKEITTKGPPPMDIDTFFAEVKQGNVEKVKGMVESARGYLYTTSKVNFSEIVNPYFIQPLPDQCNASYDCYEIQPRSHGHVSTSRWSGYQRTRQRWLYSVGLCNQQQAKRPSPALGQ